MIDIHSHILPAVDDGARNTIEALEMLKIAADQGVTTQYLTPHMDFHRFPNSVESLKEEFDKFREQAIRHNINITLKLAAEIRIGVELMSLAKNNSIPYLCEFNGNKAFLLEFPRTEIPHGSDKLISWLTEMGYTPIIVHPERNHVFQTKPQLLHRFINLGCLLQITSSSVTGKFGKACQSFSYQLIKNRHVAAVASDCHNLKGRRPDLIEGLTAIKNSFGQEITNNICNFLWQDEQNLNSLA